MMMDSALADGTFRPKRFVARVFQYLKGFRLPTFGVRRRLSFGGYELDETIDWDPELPSDQRGGWIPGHVSDFSTEPIADTTTSSGWSTVSGSSYCGMSTDWSSDTVFLPDSPERWNPPMSSTTEEELSSSASALQSSCSLGSPTASSLGSPSYIPMDSLTESYVCPDDWTSDTVFLPSCSPRVNTTVTVAAAANGTYQCLPSLDSLTESYVCPTDWSEDSVFFPTGKGHVNATVVVEPTTANRTYDCLPSLDSLTESYVCPTDWSEDSVFFPTVKGHVNATVVVEAKILGTTVPLREGPREDLSWIYPEIESFSENSWDVEPRCSTPIPPEMSEVEPATAATSWLPWVPLVCVVAASVGLGLFNKFFN